MMELAKIEAAFVATAEARAGELEPASRDFLKRITNGGLHRFDARLRQYRFEGLSNVLDAGCGFGQWSLALARLNKSVEAIDISASRVALIEEVARLVPLENLSARQGSLPGLPFADASFDGVYSYGVIFLTDWKKTLADFRRVMRPGGRLFVNANAFGWYKHLWQAQHNKGEGYDPREHVGRILMNTRRYETHGEMQSGLDVVIEPDELIRELRDQGFKIISEAPDGLAGLADGEQPAVPPFFPAAYGDDRGVFEVLAVCE